MLSPLNNLGAVVNSRGEMEPRLYEFIVNLTRQVNESTPFTGTGSPENVIKAKSPKLYFDTNAAAGSNLYVKKTGAGTTGWQLV